MQGPGFEPGRTFNSVLHHATIIGGLVRLIAFALAVGAMNRSSSVYQFRHPCKTPARSAGGKIQSLKTQLKPTLRQGPALLIVPLKTIVKRTNVFKNQP